MATEYRFDSRDTQKMIQGIVDRKGFTEFEDLREHPPVMSVGTVFYPSDAAFADAVKKKLGGCPVDIKKAQKVLHWKPTPWEKVVKDTVEFYESAIRTVHFDRARRDIIRTMQTYFTDKPYNVIRGLREVYGMAYPEPRDEL